MMAAFLALAHRPSAVSAAPTTNSVALNEQSVVLITGAAGFIGSELAMALHRTYNVSKLILMDSLENIKPGGLAAQHNKHTHTSGHRSESDLALFEFRRQRLFHVLQVCGSKAHFYRTDMRPTIPEYFDQGEVPVLDLVFRQHEDITHVVHLADPYHRANLEAQEVQDVIDNVLHTQAVPRTELQMKSGMMEAVLEQLRLHHNVTGRMPHLVYASSYEVYHHTPGKTPDSIKERPNPPPFSEAKPITTPSTLGGAAKLLDEILARTYYELEDVYSVGLRYFSVYGPWGMPGSPMFDMIDRAANSQPILSENERNILDHLRDFVYIEDAIDATMAAMQFRPITESSQQTPPPVVINVGTGQPLCLRQVAKRLHNLNPKAKMQGPEGELAMRDRQQRSYASTERARELLGFTARYDIDAGLAESIAWHYDRAFPYGNPNSSSNTNKDKESGNKNSKDSKDSSPNSKMTKKGITSCNRFDEECLKGVPVFPCASECAHPEMCTPSMLDDVVAFTRMLTEKCDVVMYTVDLSETLRTIPSSRVQVSKRSQSHVKGGEGSFCNLAFVSETSPLVQTLKREGVGETLPLTDEPVLMNGFWALVPVTMSTYAQAQISLWSLTPKLSPSSFFHPHVKMAIYADPFVIFDNIPTLVEEASMQPNHPKVDGATALVIGKPRKSTLQSVPVYKPRSVNDSVREQAYRMIKMAVHDEMSADGFAQRVDSSFMIHAFVEDARLFRCDVFGEVVQWNVGDGGSSSSNGHSSSTDQASIEFILGLHDMWSNVISRKSGHEPWWHGDSVETVPSGAYVVSETEGSGAATKDTNGDNGGDATHRRLEEKVDEKQQQDAAAKVATDDQAESNEFGQEGVDATGSEEDSEDEEEEEEEEEDPEATVEEEKQEEPKNDEEKQQPEEQQQPQKQSSSADQEDYDTSSYDTWLGVLSSGPTRYFARIVNWEAVGAIHLEDYQYSSIVE